jgi:hypothetical protein
MPSSILRDLFYSGPPLPVLHEEYAKRGKVDEQAQLHEMARIDIAAPLSTVWQVLVDVAGWPRWHPKIRSVTLDPAGVRVDAPFRWVSGRSTINSRFAVVEPEQELTWTGVSTGVRAVHRNVLRELPGGQVHLLTEESMAGAVIGALLPGRFLRKSLQEWVDLLKNAAEAAV